MTMGKLKKNVRKYPTDCQEFFKTISCYSNTAENKLKLFSQTATPSSINHPEIINFSDYFLSTLEVQNGEFV